MLIDLGKVGITVDTNAWSAEKPYEILTLLRYNGQGYLSLKDNISVVPDKNEDVWMLVAVKGDKGDPFVYADFTPEQLAYLMKPATDAAVEAERVLKETRKACDNANKVAGEVGSVASDAAKALKVANDLTKELTRIKNTAVTLVNDLNEVKELVTRDYNTWSADQKKWSTAENGRRTNEENRVLKETQRNSSEAARQKNAEQRAATEAQYDKNELGRRSKETERISQEKARQLASAEQKKQFDEMSASGNQLIQDIMAFDVENSGKVAAVAIVENASDIRALKDIIIQFLSGSLQAEKILTKTLLMGGAELLKLETSTPTSAPAFPGQFYIDKAGRKAYIAVDNNSVSDWIAITN